MKWYWLLRFENTKKHGMVADVCDAGHFELDRLYDCSPIDDWPEDVTLMAGPDGRNGVPDDFLQNGAGMLVLSQSLVRALTTAGIDGVQYLPATLVAKSKPAATVLVMNVLSCVAALDRKQAKYSTYDDDYFLEARRGKIASLRVPVLKGAALRNYDVCRLAEFRAPVFVSERFRTVIRTGGFSGCDFEEVQLT